MAKIQFTSKPRSAAEIAKPQPRRSEGTKVTLNLGQFGRWRQQYENEREYARATRDSDSTEVHAFVSASSGSLVNRDEPCSICGRQFDDLVHNRESFRDEAVLLSDIGEEPLNLSIDDSLEKWASRRSYSDSDADELYGLIYESRETRSQGRNQPFTLFHGLLIDDEDIWEDERPMTFGEAMGWQEPEPEQQELRAGDRTPGTYVRGVFTPKHAGDPTLRWKRECENYQRQQAYTAYLRGQAARLRRRLELNAQIISVMRACGWPEDRIVTTMQQIHVKQGLPLNEQALQKHNRKQQ